jgi:hypothetical protein
MDAMDCLSFMVILYYPPVSMGRCDYLVFCIYYRKKNSFCPHQKIEVSLPPLSVNALQKRPVLVPKEYFAEMIGVRGKVKMNL